MRLSEYEINAIKKTFKEIFKKGDIYLFGSRLDDNARGGDIDLYIKDCDKDKVKEKKLDFLVKLKQEIGDQKIDIIIARDINNPIEQEAIKKGVKL